MSSFFFMPILAAGTAFLVVPWIVHQIRRPEHEPVIFGSLMFVPDIHKKVIERRSIQHWLLMLLRMLLLLLMVLAFMRPYFFVGGELDDAKASGSHVLLIDNSFSMDTKNQLDLAKQRAMGFVDSMDETDRIGLVVFNRRVESWHEFTLEGESVRENHQRIQREIAAVRVSEQGTDYVPALRLAEEMLLENASGVDEDVEAYAHVFSDFQKAGLSKTPPDWSLSPQVELDLIYCTSEDIENFTVTDVFLRQDSEGKVRVLGQIENWGDQELERNVSLFVEGEKKEEQQVVVQPGHRMKVSFATMLDSDKSHAGKIEIEDDDLTLDNHRYFGWNPQRLRQVALLKSEPDQRRWPAAWFLENALKISQSKLWDLRVIESRDVSNLLKSQAHRMEAFLIDDVLQLDVSTAQDVITYVEQGGSVLGWIDPTVIQSHPTSELLSGMGYEILGPRFEPEAARQYELLSFIDFEHAVFYPFKGIQYNDFSSVRLYNYLQVRGVTPNQPGNNPVHVLAKVGDDPVLVEWVYGEGKMLLWMMSPVLDVTNLPRSTKFVPLLHESLLYLVGRDPGYTGFLVGDVVDLPDFIKNTGIGTVQAPGWPDLLSLENLNDSQLESLSLTGYVEWTSGVEGDVPYRFAVNIDPSESDPTRVDEQEFIQKLGSSKHVRTYNLDQLASEVVLEDEAVQREYGLWILMLLLIGLVVESVYAAKISHREWHKRVQEGEG